MVTGAQLRTLREALGLTPARFSDLLGVHFTTVYRWQAAKEPLRLEPLQAALVLYLQERAVREGAHQLGRSLEASLLRGGTLMGLAELLAPLAAKRP